MPCLPPGDLPDPGVGLGSPALQVDSLPDKLPGKHSCTHVHILMASRNILEIYTAHYGLLMAHLLKRKFLDSLNIK